MGDPTTKEALFIAVTCMWAFLLTFDFAHVDSHWQSAFTHSACSDTTNVRPNCQHCSIVYLGELRRAAKLRDSMWMLFRNFNDRYCYPIIVFHTSEFNPIHFRKYLARDFSSAQIGLITFHPITFDFPTTYDEAAARRDGLVFEVRYPQYHHMIAFWFKHIFDHATSNRAEYWWRLDSDSYIYSPIRYDVFAFMKRHQLQYGYRAWYFEGKHYVQGLWSFLRDFLEKHKLVPKQRVEPDADGRLPLVYNNFEIMHMPTFRDQKESVLYRDAVYATNKIYAKRWGDAPLRAVQVCMLLPSHKVHHFCDIEYYHQEWFHSTCAHREDRSDQLLNSTSCSARAVPPVMDGLRLFRDKLGDVFNAAFGI